MDAFEIIPTQGVGHVRFGQTPAEVQARMSEPQVYEEWMGGNLNDSLLYQGLILGFDRCDSRGPLRNSRLVEARIADRPGATLFRKQVTDWTRNDLAELLRSRGYKIRDSRHDIGVEALGLSVSFSEAGRVDFVELWQPATALERAV